MQMISKNQLGRTTLEEPPIPSVTVGAASVAESRKLLAPRKSKWVRRVHAFLGVVSAFNLLLLISTGFLLQHASLLKLDEKTIPRAVLPRSYRPQDGNYGVRADIFVADLHSGRLFGTAGAVTLDVITLAWLTLLTTGLVMYVSKQREKQKTPNGDAFLEDEG